MSWKKVKFGSLYKIDSRNGLTKPSKVRGEGYKMINMGELFSYDRIYDIPMELVPLKDSEKINAKVEVGDLLFARQSLVLEGAGKCSIVMETSDLTVFESHIIRVRLKSEENPLFYYYYFKSPLSPVSTIVSQCAQAGIRGSDLSNLEVICPSRDIQDKIVDILSAYDNLIENNQKQIKLLEEAAQRLYKEWFVDLQFLGHENVEIVDGVPEGWNIRKLGDLNHRLESGSRPKGGIDSNLKDGIPSIGAENVIGLGKYNFSSEKLISKEFYENMNKGKLKDRDILIYKDGAYIGRTSLFQDDFPHREASVNEHVFLLHMDDESLQYYVFLTLYRPEYYLKMQNLNKNAAQPGINMKVFKTLDILVPDESIVVEFNDLVSPMIKSIFSKSKQIKILTEARDRLLPKLMSGEIEV
jgi:type I restriction enzyme, S subunit